MHVLLRAGASILALTSVPFNSPWLVQVADPRYHPELCLWAAIHGYSHMIVTAAMNNQTIVDSRGPEGVTPLILACQYGHLDTINTLLELVRSHVCVQQSHRWLV